MIVKCDCEKDKKSSNSLHFCTAPGFKAPVTEVYVCLRRNFVQEFLCEEIRRRKDFDDTFSRFQTTAECFTQTDSLVCSKNVT